VISSCPVAVETSDCQKAWKRAVQKHPKLQKLSSA